MGKPPKKVNSGNSKETGTFILYPGKFDFKNRFPKFYHSENISLALYDFDN
jgi:hypothetical protein